MNINILKNRSPENQLCSELSTLLRIHTLFMIATGMSNIFLNVFIWKVSHNIRLVIEYNIWLALTLPFIYAIGGWIGKRKGVRINLIMGMFLYTLFYLVVFFLRDNITQHIAIVGILRAVGAGFYYVAYSILGYDFSTDKNRDYFFGMQGIINSVAAMLSPFISGYIISNYAGNQGYEIIFVASFLMFFVGSIMSFALPNRFSKSEYHLLPIAALPFKNVNWAKIMASEWARGTRDLVMSFLINIMIYKIAVAEKNIGNFSLWTYLVATAACYTAGIVISPKTRVKALFIGTFLTAISSSIFLFKNDMTALWIYGVITSISINLIFIPHNTISWAVIASIPNSRERRIEAIIIKELFLNLGRLTSLSIFAFIADKNFLTPHLIFALGAVQIVMWLMLKNIDTHKIKKHITTPSLEFEEKIVGIHHNLHLANKTHSAVINTSH